MTLTEDGPEGIAALTEDGPEGMTLTEFEPEGIALTEDGPEGIALTEVGPDGIALAEAEPEGIAITEVGPEVVVLTEEDESDSSAEKSTLFGFDEVLETLLGKEAQERSIRDFKLDLLDKNIEQDGKATALQHKVMDKRMNDLQCSIKKREEAISVSKSRAEQIKKISIEEIKFQAESSMTHIQETEDGEKETERKVMYFKSAGHQQKLLYKQIWEPFTETQFGMHIFSSSYFLNRCVLEAALEVLTAWHKEKDETDEEYILNVTLPGIITIKI